MKRAILIIVSLLVATALHGQNVPEYHSEHIEASDRYQSSNIFQKDLLLYADMLATTHPYFANVEHRAQLDKRVRKVYKACGDISDVADFKLELAKLAASLGDGHTAISYWSNTNMLFPVRFVLDGSRPAIIDVCPEEQRELLGKEVVKVNGKPLRKILDSAREIISADNDVNFENMAKEYLMIAEFWSFLRMSNEVMTLTLADGTSVDIKAVSKQQLKIAQLQQPTAERVTARRNTLFDYSIFDEEGICYLQFNQFADRLIYPQYPQLVRFDEFMAEMMAEIEAKDVRTIVVDLQYNGGGNSSLGDVLLSWLYPHADTKHYGVDVRVSELMCKFYPHYGEFTFDGEPLKMGEVYDMWRFDHNRGVEVDYSAPQDSAQHVLNYDAERIFKGRVVFVEGRDSYSSTTLLLTMARDNGIGIIVGEPSGGKPNHYGDLLYCTLPNTHTIATVSHKRFVRPDSELKECDYLMPDIEIELRNPDRDILWEWIVRHCDKRKSPQPKSDDDSYIWDTIYSPSMNN